MPYTSFLLGLVQQCFKKCKFSGHLRGPDGDGCVLWLLPGQLQLDHSFRFREDRLRQRVLHSHHSPEVPGLFTFFFLSLSAGLDSLFYLASHRGR